MLRRTVLKGMAATAAGGSLARSAAADTPLKIGISIPLTGCRLQCGRTALQAALKLYMQQHGDTVAARKIELIIRDDSGVADNARRLIQESSTKRSTCSASAPRRRRWPSRRLRPRPRR